jgi:hypothetical protein
MKEGSSLDGLGLRGGVLKYHILLVELWSEA